MNLVEKNKQTMRTLISDTLLANISQNASRLSSLRKVRESRLLHRWACICMNSSGQALRVTSSLWASLTLEDSNRFYKAYLVLRCR